MPGKPPVIVTYAHRPKRAPRKRAPAAKIAGSAIVTMRAKPGRFGTAPDLTDEEHQRRGDAADALWRELVRRATGKA
jgi:hypothetical protein